MKTITQKRITLMTLLMGSTIAMTVFAALAVPSTALAQRDDRDSICVFSKEAKASMHIDPWAPSAQAFKRFGAVENADEVAIQNCKGVTDQYLALTIGNRESSLASDSGNVVISPELGLERCDFTPGIKKIPWLISQTDRETAIRNRVKTLRACVALRVSSLNGRPLVLGNHPSCKWTAAGTNSYIARGAVCTVKLEQSSAIAVKPIIEDSCMTAARFESGEIQPADLNTALQAFVTSDEKASVSSAIIGVSGRRIVFAPSPKVVAFDEDMDLRFPKTLNLKIQPSAIDIATQRAKDEATSYITMQMVVRNVGSRSSSYPVPLAAEAELFELTDVDGKTTSRTVSTWMAYASGQTLVPADWSGVFVTDRAEIPDFAFRHGKRYRIRLKYFHPHDVPGLLQAEIMNRPQSFSFNTSSFDVAKFPTLNFLRRVPMYSGFPIMGRGPQDHQPGSQISATEKEILQFFRQLGVDAMFPARYNKICDDAADTNCAQIGQATFFGQSVIDFTAEATPGQVSEMKAVSFDSYTKLATDKAPTAVHFDKREGIECN